MEAERGTGGGGVTSENAGMSSEKMCENRMRRKPEVSDGRSVRVGSVGPKPQPQGAGDGQPVNTPVPPGPSEGVTPP